MISKSYTYWALAACAASAFAMIVMGMMLTNNQRELPRVNSSSSPMRTQTARVGGVERPRSDVDSLTKKAASSPSRVEFQIKSTAIPPEDARYPYGRIPLVTAETNSSAKNIIEAISSKDLDRIRRLHLYAQIEPFDFDTYKSNPQAYLEEVVPARIWQSAQPGDGVPRLKAASPQRADLVQGETVRLKVTTLPNAPANFYAFDLGAFQNQLTAITVQADSEGVATAEYTATSGTVNLARILASSPVASGTREFQVSIRLPASRTLQ